MEKDFVIFKRYTKIDLIPPDFLNIDILKQHFIKHFSMNFDINNPLYNDNRNYAYPEGHSEFRREYRYFIDSIPSGSRVIDLGCGDGSLIELLKKDNNCDVTGIELADSGVNSAQKRGLNVIKGRIDETLPFTQDEFDFAICNTTLQMVMYPETLLKEMIRISEKQIISFPNFAFYKNRFQLFFGGRMPARGLFGYQWYNTGHIHQLSCTDFLSLLYKLRPGARATLLNTSENDFLRNFLIGKFPNLFHIFPIYLISKS